MVRPATAQPAATPDTNLVITGLTADTTYGFTVTALYGSAGSSVRRNRVSARETAVASARVAVTTGRWKNGDTRIQGSTDTAPTAGTIRFYKVGG